MDSNHACLAVISFHNSFQKSINILREKEVVTHAIDDVEISCDDSNDSNDSDEE